MYPVNPLWVENLVYIGREKLGVEFIDQVVELDHWAYGPHHAWTYPESGQLLRMWQPFNGLQVYPNGVGKKEMKGCQEDIAHSSDSSPPPAQGQVDPDAIGPLPPPKCLLGGAPLRVGCTDDGYPEPELREPNVQLTAQVSYTFSCWTTVPHCLHQYSFMNFMS